MFDFVKSSGKYYTQNTLEVYVNNRLYRLLGKTKGQIPEKEYQKWFEKFLAEDIVKLKKNQEEIFVSIEDYLMILKKISKMSINEFVYNVCKTYSIDELKKMYDNEKTCDDFEQFIENNFKYISINDKDLFVKENEYQLAKMKYEIILK